MPRKPTLKEAKAWAIRIYTLALAKAERGDWRGARGVTSSENCRFCDYADATEIRCPECIVSHLCSSSGVRSRRANLNAWLVCSGSRTPANGLRHFRRTIEQLEKLEV